MRIIGLAGWSGSGKTTLLAQAIPRIVARGLTVSTLKHAHHDFDVDQPGKDSHTHRLAGATEVLHGDEAEGADDGEAHGTNRTRSPSWSSGPSGPNSLTPAEPIRCQPPGESNG